MTTGRPAAIRTVGTLAILAAVVAAFASSATARPRATGTVTVAQPSDPTNMDPALARDIPTRNVLRHLYDPLVERRTIVSKKRVPTIVFRPILALKWKRVGLTTWRFTLRRGVRFAGGQPFDAATVKYNVDRILGRVPGTQPGLATINSLTTLSDARVVSRYVVDIVTSAPDPVLLGRMTSFFMIPKGAVDSAANALSSNPNGTGAYRLVTWDRNNQVVLQANTRYFLGAPRIARVIFRTMPDAAARLAAIKSGDVDVVTNIPPDNVAEVNRSGRAKVAAVPSVRTANIWLDTLTNPQLKNKDVRLALNYAVDVNAIIKQVLRGYAIRTAAAVPPYFTGYNPKVKPYPYNVAKAKQLLASAGYPNGFSMDMMVPINFGVDVPQAIAGYLAQVGVKVNIRTMDFVRFAQLTQNEHKIFDTLYASLNTPLFDPQPFMELAVLSGTKGLSWYNNPRADALIRAAGRTLNDKVRAKILGQLQATIHADPPFIFLFAYKQLFGVSNRLAWKPRKDELIYMYTASIKR